MLDDSLPWKAALKSWSARKLCAFVFDEAHIIDKWYVLAAAELATAQLFPVTGARIFARTLARLAGYEAGCPNGGGPWLCLQHLQSQS
jgi:hypothetical protein